ncbi:hypothetical protein ACMBCN_01480 [Candidatus Liberibacter asiaticus]|nr:hypothetical protein [Candidatus Liberibacter asiaticus]
MFKIQQLTHNPKTQYTQFLSLFLFSLFLFSPFSFLFSFSLFSFLFSLFSLFLSLFFTSAEKMQRVSETQKF